MTEKTEVVLVCGWSGPVSRTARSLLRPGTAIVRLDLAHVGEGVVRRTVTTVDAERDTMLELAHGCVSCTVREGLLPLLRTLSQRSNVDRIVVRLDPELEPDAVIWAIDHVVVAGINGRVDGPASVDVAAPSVVVCVDADTWLRDATGDDALDDDRTVAQIVVGQVACADVVVTVGDVDASTNAVLSRLAPEAVVCQSLPRRLPIGRNRGFDTHSPLLRGEPPLDVDHGVSLVEFAATRPFHPERLHEAVDVLLDGVVTARGRVWVATQPDDALWLESAGGGLRVASGGRWLAAMTSDEQEQESAERRAMAALHWDSRFGDRHISLVVLVHTADPDEIHRALTWALLTDDEMSGPWVWHDPFGEYHEDPCETSGVTLTEKEAHE
ncbi:ribosome hibernation factor-recruiting GTPase MRF [Rhodococcoides trifolii]|uniref:ribosome hibernation factor-recruiting GTPase MRF n=1 Tax=Rhodococcoides trifolii TaxID=908250 RepID=UPI001E33DF93|nr:GTP-binding protein [Rhodococcus trifolii]